MIYLGDAGDAFVTDLRKSKRRRLLRVGEFSFIVESGDTSRVKQAGFKISGDLCVHTAVEEVGKDPLHMRPFLCLRGALYWGHSRSQC